MPVSQKKTHFCCSWRRHFVRFMWVKWKLQYFVRIACTFFRVSFSLPLHSYAFGFNGNFYIVLVAIWFCASSFALFHSYPLCVFFFFVVVVRIGHWIDQMFNKIWCRCQYFWNPYLRPKYQDIIYYTTVWLPVHRVSLVPGIFSLFVFFSIAYFFLAMFRDRSFRSCPSISITLSWNVIEFAKRRMPRTCS